MVSFDPCDYDLWPTTFNINRVRVRPNMSSQSEEGGRGRPQRENPLWAIVIYGQNCVRRGREGQMTPQKSVSSYLDNPETVKSGQSLISFDPGNFNLRPSKSMGQLLNIIRSFPCHFVDTGELKLQLWSGNNPYDLRLWPTSLKIHTLQSILIGNMILNYYHNPVIGT